jgi:arginyl-tRNA synthetase
MWKYGLLNKDFGYEQLDYDTQAKPLWGTTSSPEKTPAINGKKVTFSNSDAVIDVIGGEQTYAMSVVKKSLEYLGYHEHASNMTHVNYGFVYLSPKTAQALGIDVSDGKDKYGMSGRKGWGVKIDDFINMLDAKLKAEYGDFGAIRDVRNGAIKFEMLKYNTFQDLVFDLEGALSLKGFSGPYIQYTHARANSVLEKALYSPSSIIGEVPDEIKEVEIQLLRTIYLFGETVQRSAVEFAPNILCNYLFELSQVYNNFYNGVSILNAETPELKEFRLLITYCVKQVLRNGLHLLGIDAPNKM